MCTGLRLRSRSSSGQMEKTLLVFMEFLLMYVQQRVEFTGR